MANALYITKGNGGWGGPLTVTVHPSPIDSRM
jgi:sorbitol-specific phosphotransferase system component IIBC